MMLSLTYRCNIRCIHCFYHSELIKDTSMFTLRGAKKRQPKVMDSSGGKAVKQSDVDPVQTLDLIEDLLAMGTRSFLFTGGGEPFLHKNLLDFVRYAKKAGSSCMVNTNGTLLNPDVIDEIVDFGFDELKITTMAGTADMYALTHPGIRGEVFDRLRENLLYLSERKLILGVQKPVVNLVFIAVSQNHDGITDFTKFAQEVSADRVSFRSAYAMDDPGLSKILPTENESTVIRSDIEAARAFLDSQRIPHDIDYFLRTHQKQIDTKRLYKMIPCYYGWLQPRVEVNGSVYPCCRCYESLGNAYHMGFKAVWHGEAYRKFRKSAIRINKRGTSVHACGCDHCPHHTANIRVHKRMRFGIFFNGKHMY